MCTMHRAHHTLRPPLQRANLSPPGSNWRQFASTLPYVVGPGGIDQCSGNFWQKNCQRILFLLHLATLLSTSCFTPVVINYEERELLYSSPSFIILYLLLLSTMKSVSASIIQGSAIGPALCCKWI